MSTRPMECGSCGKDHPSTKPCPKPAKKLWEHTGGGCALVGSRKGFVCDDSYENTETKEEVVVLTTWERHFKMPLYVSKPSDLTRLVGVSKQVKRFPPRSEP